ncbi:MAG: GNAT family N-acetyltransferase [Thalassobius sp.]|nr:GNAT family N-acetyltransferase [Thalassovita sp.]
MRLATKKDKDVVLDILTNSFEDNVSVNYVIKSQNNKLKYIRNLMEYSFNVCLEFGEVWINDSNSACVLLQYSAKAKTTVKSILWDIDALFNCFGVKNVKKVLSRQSAIKDNYPYQDYIYLWYIGVNPDQQGDGLGTKLLEEVRKKAKQLTLPVLLETSMKDNVPWYEKNNFVVYKELQFDHNLYLLRLEES